jgi:4-hydroxy-tetrahydrodipicolinate reductase
MAIGIIVCGAAGRMGGAVIRAIASSTEFRLAGAIDNPASGRLGRDAGEIAGAGHCGIALTDRIDSVLQANTVIVDFSAPAASLKFLRAAAKKRVAAVIATTGFTAAELVVIKGLSRRTPTLLSANTSLGVNVLTSLLGKAAAMLGNDYDVEIIEAHHRFKKDAPSGTALALGRSIANALGRNLDKIALNGRKGITGERTRKEIALLSVRAGDIVGEHTVIFGGIGERLEFVHRAHSRETFARGALRAATWLANKKPGLYGMSDVLGR